MAGTLNSPRVEQKILGKRAAWKLKNGSPKFKDVLRQRCRLRIKERRSHFIAQARGLKDLQDVEQSLTDILREEYNRFVQEFESDFVEYQWDDEELNLPKENQFEEDEWLLNQFDYMFDDDALQRLLDNTDVVVCPLCLKGSLKEMREGFLRCDNCLTRVSGCSRLSEIQQHISRCLEAHTSLGCNNSINFFVNSEEETPYLFSLCHDCSYFDFVG